MLEPVLERGVVEQGHIATQHARNLGIDLVTPFMQLGDTQVRVGLTARAHLLEQFEQGKKPGLGAHESPFTQACEPCQGAFGSRGQVKVGFIGAAGIKLAQPSFFVRRPVVQVVLRGLGKQLFAVTLAQAKQAVFQHLRKIGLGHHPHVRHDEYAMQKAGNQRCVLGHQQTPGGMLATQHFQRGVVEVNVALPQ